MRACVVPLTRRPSAVTAVTVMRLSPARRILFVLRVERMGCLFISPPVSESPDVQRVKRDRARVARGSPLCGDDPPRLAVRAAVDEVDLAQPLIIVTVSKISSQVTCT